MTATLAKENAPIASAHSSASVENILLILDGEPPSKAAIPVACKLAETYAATLHVTYVGERRLEAREIACNLGFSTEQRHGAVFDDVSGDALGRVSKMTAQLSRPLIVMSTQTGRPAADKDRFASITESVVATRPERMVLLTPDPSPQPWVLSRILLAHDGTPTSTPATCPAAELAQLSGAEVIALHVAARGHERPREPGSLQAPRYLDQPQHEWPAWAEEFMNRVLASGASPTAIQFQLAVTSGRPGSEIAELARERLVNLVVMAWHGHWDHQTCATRVVIQASGCPVLLVYSAEN
ncbi:MAG: universal stress protein [Acidobacteria bacterium]|nr:universal stress protein [Acidobacteriota bacterium]